MMENENKGGSTGKLLKYIIIIVFLVIVAVVVLYFFNNRNKSDDRVVNTVTTSTLAKVVEKSDLQTVEFIYNGVAEKKNKKKTMYYVSYEGKVKAGIDVSEVEITLDKASNTITVIIPEAEIKDCTVDESSLEYIFMKDKYDTATVPSEAYKLCLKDIKDEASDTDIIEKANENAINIVKGLIQPIVGDDYSIDVEVKNDEEVQENSENSAA